MSQPIQPISDPNDSNHNLDTESQTTLENPKTINTTFFLSIGFMIWLIATFAVYC